MSQPVPAADDDRPMARTYSLVIACHAAVITILWWVGRIFSR
jgi:hypothetical protein